MPNVKELITKSQSSYQDDLRRLQKIVDEQAATIERMRNAKVRAPRASGKVKGRKSFIRLIFGDVHGEHMDRQAVAAFLKDVSILRPQEVICIGDLIDCGGFLSQHKTLGVVAELDATYEQDVDAGNMILDEVQNRAAPGARFDYIEGNHENRVNRWICDQVLRHRRNAEYLQRLVGPQAVLNTDKRGIRYVRRDGYYDGLSVSGTVKLAPHAVAQHGEAARGGKYSMFRLMERLGESVFFGHTHRLGSAYGEKLDGHIVAVNTGCLCQIRPLYNLTSTTDWTHGYVAEVVQPGHGFLAIPVPIVGGVSYLQPLAKLLNL